MVIGGAHAFRAGLAERGERGINQFRIDLAQVLVANAEGLERTRPVIFHQHIGGGDKLPEDFAALFRFQVQGDGTLVGPLGEKAGAHASMVQLVVGA